MKIKSNRYCANSLIFKDNFHEKVCWTSLLPCNHRKQLEHAYFNSLAFILNILLSNHFEAYTIVFKSQIIFFFFVNTFLWCKQHQLDLVEIPVMLAKSGCDDTSDKWCWEGNRDWTLVWGGGRVEWTCKWLVSARNYSSISSQVI